MTFEKTVGQYEVYFEVFKRRGSKDCAASYWLGKTQVARAELPADVQAEFEAFEDDCWERYDEENEEYESPIEWSDHD